MIGLIWAQGRGRAIGARGAVPWDLPEDRAHFAAVTRGHGVVMGRLTWGSFPDRYRPLPGRRNVVLTRDASWGAPGAVVAPDLDAALAAAAQVGEGADGDVWVVGGAQVYALALPLADVLDVTEVDVDVPDADALAPEVGGQWAVLAREPAAGWSTSRTGLRHRTRRLVRADRPPGVGRGRFDTVAHDL